MLGKNKAITFPGRTSWGNDRSRSGCRPDPEPVTEPMMPSDESWESSEGLNFRHHTFQNVNTI